MRGCTWYTRLLSVPSQNSAWFWRYVRELSWLRHLSLYYKRIKWMLWFLQVLNLWPSDYESDALTNWAKEPLYGTSLPTHPWFLVHISVQEFVITIFCFCDRIRTYTASALLRCRVFYLRSSSSYLISVFLRLRLFVMTCSLFT